MDSLPGYDAWKTTAPEREWGRCPTCGCPQVDAASVCDVIYICPECGDQYSDAEAHVDPALAREDALLDRAGL